MNNFYGMGGQPIGETMGFEYLSRAGAALNPDNMHAETLDGNNPLAVADAYARKRAILEAGDGPVLLDVQCYRQTGHSPSDQSSYREREEIEMWRAVDPITEFGAKLVDAGVASQADLDIIQAYVTKKVTKACKLGTNDGLSPRMKLTPHTGLAEIMFSNIDEAELPGLEREDDVLMPLEENPRVKQIAKKFRSGLDEKGNMLKESKAVAPRRIFEAVVHHFYTNRALWPTVKRTATGAARSPLSRPDEGAAYHRCLLAYLEGAIGTSVGSPPGGPGHRRTDVL